LSAKLDVYGGSYQILAVLRRNPFIIPSAPVLKRQPPTGDQWIHEVKFDGWRGQLHKAGDDVTIFSRNGKDLTSRFKAIRDSLLALPARSAIIDAEIVVCGTDGMPDFKLLMEKGAGDLCAWCFDLLELNGRDIRYQPLVDRKAKLRELLIAADNHVLRYSDEFSDAVKLLAVADKNGLEGVVSKLSNQPYRSGKNLGWIKVKCAAWREANRDRWELFQRS
jgi:bifunctional non-homologous end joining protein LigD